MKSLKITAFLAGATVLIYTCTSTRIINSRQGSGVTVKSGDFKKIPMLALAEGWLLRTRKEMRLFYSKINI